MLSGYKSIVLTLLIATCCFSIACGSDPEDQQSQDFAEFQATVVAILSEDRQSIVASNVAAPLAPLAPLPTYTPLPTQVPFPTLEPLATYTPLPTQIPLPTLTPFPTPILPTATPTQTPLPTPTPTPLGYLSVMSRSGIIVVAGGGLQGTFAGAVESPGESDTYTFNAVKGQNLAVTMSSTEIDTLIELIDPDGSREMRVDDVGASTNSSFSRSLSKSGTYLLIAKGATSGLSDYGDYTINFTLSVVTN